MNFKPECASAHKSERPPTHNVACAQARNMSCVPTRNILKNQRGVLTLDFMFALVIAFGFTTIFFALSLSLSMVEVTQYISFAAARCYAGAHETIGAQQALAQNKYKQLMAVPVFKTLFATGWFTLGQPTIGDFNSEYPQSGGADSATFIGARIKFTAKVLDVRLPFLGSTAGDSNTGVANISTYLMREVSTTECRETFARNRFVKLKALAAEYKGTPSQGSALMPDNGC